MKCRNLFSHLFEQYQSQNNRLFILEQTKFSEFFILYFLFL